MKSLSAVPLLLLLGLLIAPCVQAQKQNDRIDRLVAMLGEKLALSKDQTAKIHAVLEASENQAKQDREANNGNRLLLKKAARVRMQKLDKEFAGVLTDEQRKSHPGIMKEIHRYMLEPAEGGHRKRE